MLHRLSGPLNALLACGIARRAGDDVFDLFVDEEEASQGGMVYISMRVAVRCPACGGGDSARCGRCDATGTVDEPYSAWLAVRPGVADAAVLAPSARFPGMLRPVSFRVRRRAGSSADRM
jgi:hypothetical protein